MKKPQSKESVGRTLLVFSSATAVLLGGLLYDSKNDLEASRESLSETKEAVIDLQKEYEFIKKTNSKLAMSNKNLKQESKRLTIEKSELVKQVKSLKKKKIEQEREMKEKKRKEQALKEANSSKVNKTGSTYSGYKNWKRMNVEATGYSLISDELGSDGTPYTATGTYPRAGHTIAVDPLVIPYGTKVFIPEFNKVFVAEDTGGMIKGSKIDIYMSHGNEARLWGRKTIQIYIEK